MTASPVPERPIRPAAGIGDLAADYDLFLVDQWGVLHDGRQAFPEARECLHRLLALGKTVAILSNSGRGAAENARRLEAMGLAPEAYSLLLTSGELARECLARRQAPFPPELGSRCLLLAGAEAGAILAGLPVDAVATAAEADFVLLAGTDDAFDLADYARLLEPALQRGLLLVCTNPDLVRFSPRGLTFSAGEIARQYAAAGGRVEYLGKPDPRIYAWSRVRLPGFAPERTLAVGDSFPHDVAGGSRAGFATALVADGVHRDDFAGLDDAGRLARALELGAGFGAAPDWLMPRFRW